MKRTPKMSKPKKNGFTKRKLSCNKRIKKTNKRRKKRTRKILRKKRKSGGSIDAATIAAGAMVVGAIGLQSVYASSRPDNDNHNNRYRFTSGGPEAGEESYNPLHKETLPNGSGGGGGGGGNTDYKQKKLAEIITFLDDRSDGHFNKAEILKKIKDLRLNEESKNAVWQELTVNILNGSKIELTPEKLEELEKLINAVKQ